jgi:hypothetical protein
MNIYLTTCPEYYDSYNGFILAANTLDEAWDLVCRKIDKEDWAESKITLIGTYSGHEVTPTVLLASWTNPHEP